MATLDRFIDRIESSELLDRVADALSTAVAPLATRPGLNDALTGRWLGHSVHPALVAVPIGCWSGAAVLDLTGASSGARRLTGLGVLAAVPTALTGAADWADTSGAERRVGAAHAIANDLAVTAFALSWLSRRRSRRATGMALSALGLGSMAVGGYLGGHLAYVRGVGVNTTAFQSGPQDFQRLVSVAELGHGELTQVELDGLPMVVLRRAGEVRVLEDRCTHRGAPLSDGSVVAGCVECPWHGSRFDVSDGAVVRGPASVPQPSYEVRQSDGWIEVRRTERGGLRKDPV